MYMNEHFPDIPSLVKVIDSLPALSWLVDLSDRARVFVGPQVEVQLNREKACVFEGCWDGRFDEQDFLASVNFYGSGFVVNEDKIVFSTPTHTLSSLFVLMGKKRKVVSNSLCFIFAYVGMQPTGNFGIARRTMSIVKGIKSYNRLVYDGPTEKIIRLIYCTFSISGDRIETFDKPEAPHFSNYDDYRQYLHRSLERLFENARSLKRKRQYEPVVLMSTGYDSVAAAALSANLGCQLALTLGTSREVGADSGKGIAESLGMCCVEKERASPSAVKEPHPEAQFIASGDSGDAVFYVFEEELKNKLVLTGHQWR